MVRNILITGLFLCLNLLTFAQSTYGTLEGVVTDEETGEGFIAARIVVLKSGDYIQTTEGFTDISGSYSISNIPSGRYTVEITYVGYHHRIIQSVAIEKDQTFKLSVKLVEGYTNQTTFCTFTYYPFVDHYKMETGRIFTKEDIRNSPIKW